jgi:alkanesulfonate monooxygenase SsuD/methylene tetrahydromethanopterin reductase-like flavin-dependent oxidoreductase (luciferase family)
VKFGVICNTGHHGVDPDGMIAVARHAEDRGFESFYMPEHVALYDLTADDVARHAAQGVDRLVVAPASAEASEQRDQLSAFADRLALR